MKIINTSDFHFSMEWLDISRMCGEAVAKAAREKEVDLIVTSDWFDKPILATDKGGLSAAKEIMKSWLDVCPVVAVEGTPSHDAPGCYGVFEEMELTVLRPGKVYGYHDSKDHLGQYHFFGRVVFEESIDDIYDEDYPAPSAILFGFPELNKHNIQARLGIQSDQANAEAVNLFNQYLAEFVAPMRLRYKDIPAFGVLHGNVSDCSRSNETDMILKASDIVIHTEDMAVANLDYWFLGHIHTPWESEKIRASYPGSPALSWKDKGFLPGFEYVDTDSMITRIAYGTPMRLKVNSASLCTDPAIAYWLTSGEDLPETCHPWSKVTHEKEKVQTRRVTQEEAEAARTLWDLFLLFDPTLPPELKEKVDRIEETTRTEQHGEKAVRMTYLRIEGCEFFGGQTVEFDLSTLPETLTAITGENGDGKSSLLSFCSPYPIVIGKDTKSGRQSAIKDFFTGSGLVEKRFIVDGKEHKHIITVKSKTECYADIDGIPQLEKATFDTLMEWCEKEYGAFEDYRITTFYEQPQQSAKGQSGLMNANRTEARNVVQNIAKIDHEKEKRFALDRAAETQKEADRLASKIETAETFLEDVEELQVQRTEIEKTIEQNRKSEKEDAEHLADLTVRLEKAKETQREIIRFSSEAAKALDETETRLRIIGSLTEEVETLTDAVSSLEENRGLIRQDDEARKHNAKEKERELAYEKQKQSYNDAVNSHAAAVREKENCERTIGELQNRLSYLVPCEHCGRLASTAEKEKEEIDRKIITEKNFLERIVIPEYPEELSDFITSATAELQNRSAIEQAISEAETAEARMKDIDTEVKRLNGEIEELKKEAVDKTQKANSIRCEDMTTLEKNLYTMKENVSVMQRAIASGEEKLRFTEERIKKAEQQAEDLKADRSRLEQEQKDADEWTQISKLLNPDKVPALELDLVLDAIDSEATQNIEPFLDGRYSYQTRTQDENGVDRFDIIIHDNETGKDFSMFYVNPGNKAFYSDCYVKALISQRNRKMKRSYSPIISDEQDAPISPERVSMYYDIQRSYFENREEAVLVVTQKKEVALAYIQNQIRVKELFR